MEIPRFSSLSDEIAETAPSRRLTRSEGRKRVQMVMDDRLVDRLERLRLVAGDVSISETIRNALLLYSEMANSVSRGNKIIIESPDGDRTVLQLLINVQPPE